MEASEKVKEFTKEDEELCAKLMVLLKNIGFLDVGFVKALHKPTGERHILVFYQYGDLDIPIMKVLGLTELDNYLSPGAEEKII